MSPVDALIPPQEVGFEDFVEKFAAVVAVESNHRERPSVFNPLKADTHFATALAPECRKLGPTPVEVGEGETPKETAAAAAVRYGISFESTEFVEGLGAATDRDEFFDPITGSPGFATEAATARAAIGRGDAI